MRQRQLGYFQRFWLNEWLPMFRFEHLAADLVAALSVTLVAIPLSLAVAVASGVAPQVGLISALAGGVLGALFGGCRLGVTGPAVAMSVLIASTVQEYGFTGLLVVGLICGVLQIIAGLLKWGRLAKIIPVSLVLAFTAGIGFLLFLNQIPHLFQVPVTSSNLPLNIIHNYRAYWDGLWSHTAGIAVLTMLTLAIVPRFLPRPYAFLLAAILPSALAYFGHFTDVRLIGEVPHELLHPDAIEFEHISHWGLLLVTGLSVFSLSSFETLLSTHALDLVGNGELHNPDQELIGQGIANLGVAFFGGIPVTGVIARSSVNILAGAKTRRAAILQTVMIFVIVFFAANLIALVPMAVLSGILLAAAFKMMNLSQIIHLWKNDKLEVVIYLITLGAIITTDLVEGIQTGMFAAFIIAGFRMMRSADIKLWTNNHVLRVGLNGNISFLSYENLSSIKEYALEQAGLKFVIFEFSQVQGIDSSGINTLVDIAGALQEQEIKVIFHGASDEQKNAIAINTHRQYRPYSVTVTEFEVKSILERAGVKHSANDVLKHGVLKYASNYAKENKHLLSTLAQGQKPHTLLITCSDSRLNPNAFFSANIGELFIVRNVGNVVPPYMPNNIYSEIAAIEYAVHELGVRNIVICAHTECGAVKASYESGSNNLGYVGLDNWLSIIKSGFRAHPPRDVADGVRVNLLNQAQNLNSYPRINEMIEKGDIILNSWVYDVHSGHMLEWNKDEQSFNQIV